MANKKAKTDNKNLITGICAALVVVVVIVVAVVLATSGNKLNDAFFVSDSTKYVATMDGDGATNDEEGSPKKIHMVYFYSGDKVTDMKYYYEFTSDDLAKKAFDVYKSEESEGSGTYELSGKYIIITVDSSQYEGMTAEDAKQNVEFFQKLQDGTYDDELTVDDTEDVEVTEVVDNVEDEE